MLSFRKQRIAQEQTKANPSQFRLRGQEPTRLEGFSDGVFAFALTLLIVSLEVPNSFQELMNTMRGFVVFGLCGFALYRVWISHYIFFRRYALQDSVTVLLNGALLFVVLYFVYPLKFLFTLVASRVLHIEFSKEPPQISAPEIVSLFDIYGLGFAAVYLLFALLYANALRHEQELELNRLETAMTKMAVCHHLLVASVGGISVWVAHQIEPQRIGLAGLVYLLIGAFEIIFNTLESHLRRQHPQEGSRQ